MAADRSFRINSNVYSFAITCVRSTRSSVYQSSPPFPSPCTRRFFHFDNSDCPLSSLSRSLSSQSLQRDVTDATARACPRTSVRTLSCSHAIRGRNVRQKRRFAVSRRMHDTTKETGTGNCLAIDNTRFAQWAPLISPVPSLVSSRYSLHCDNAIREENNDKGKRRKRRASKSCLLSSWRVAGLRNYSCTANPRPGMTFPWMPGSPIDSFEH